MATLFTVAASCLLGGLVSSAMEPNLGMVVGYGVPLIVVALALGALRRGRVELAAHLLVAMVFTAVNVGALVAGGFESGAFVVNCVVVVLAVMLLPPTSASVIIGGVGAVAVAFVALPGLTREATVYRPPPIIDLMSFLVAVVFLAGMSAIVSGQYRGAIRRVEAQRARLDRAIQELERTSVSKAYLDNVIGAVRDMILVSDSASLITDLNPAAAEHLGYRREDLLGRPLTDVLAEAELLDAPVVTAAAGHCLHADGRRIPVLISRGRLTAHTNQVGGFVWGMADMTVQEAAVEAVRRAHEQADAANVAKSRFLANMSHELRTPLNAIIGYSELLSEDLPTPEQQADLERIRNAGRHLLGLINGILDLSKVEAGKMELRLGDVAIPQLAQDVADAVRPRLDAKGVAFGLSIQLASDTARLDEQKVRQILLNLLSNAAKFTEDGEVRLDITGWSRDGMPWLRFTVSDTGIGMDEAAVARVFEPFAQAGEETAQRYGGTGLGLSISRAFTRMMGGEIHVDSRLGRGTAFTVELPVGDLGQLRTPGGNVRRAKPVARLEGETLILHIDDDPSALELVQRLLAGPERRLVATSDPEEGLQWAVTLAPSLILLDVQMPLISGWAVLARLREDYGDHTTPVIVLTAEGEETVARALGATQLLRKPIDREALVRAVDAVLTR